VTPSEKLPGLHALRFIAATMVFVLHALFWSANWHKPVVDFVFTYLGMGVQLFYVVSGFALMHSTRLYSDQTTWVPQFYLKRFFRIAPLYYLMIPITILHTRITSGADDTSIVEIITNLLFINNFWPEHVYGIPAAGWSISVEFLFYFIFPLLFVIVRTIRAALLLAGLAIVGGQLSQELLKTPLLIGDYGDFAITTNFRYFAIGILAFLTYQKLRATKFGRKDASSGAVATYHLTFLAICVGLVAVIVAFDAPLRAYQRTDVAIWGVLFGVVTVWVTARDMPVLDWAPIQFFGERSYSLYLLHTLVIVWMHPVTKWVYDAASPIMNIWALVPAVLVTWLPVAMLATLSYWAIEKPGMALGKYLAQNLRRLKGTDPVVKPDIAVSTETL
jgi:peptidoglycan/LPS O-acetylase OafA/YrhL